MTITNNYNACGGYAIFANFSQNDNSCEEQIVKDASNGFNAGSVIDYTLSKCSDFFNSQIKKDKFVELSGWTDVEVSLNSIYYYYSTKLIYLLFEKF